jgi:hypothetical protein
MQMVEMMADPLPHSFTSSSPSKLTKDDRLHVPKDPDPRFIEPGMRFQHIVSSPSVRVGYLRKPKCPNAIWEPRNLSNQSTQSTPIMHAVTPAFDATRRKAPPKQIIFEPMLFVVPPAKSDSSPRLYRYDSRRLSSNLSRFRSRHHSYE